MNVKDMTAPFEILGFKFGDHEYAIEIGIVEMIVEENQITPVPNSKPFIKGVMNLRGRIVPVIDLRKVLNMEDYDDKKDANIIVTKIDDSEIGFLVDGVTEVLWVNPDEIDSGIKVEESKYFKGVVKKGERLLVLIDVSEFINDEVNEI
ncbi:chemotaxis protein CheW [Mesoaciditoga lauensis]|uniref:chemotaxis protein CheW n=1 Tax=Mesoaciditoga lauensis TaxID=1495039 RepID=UPI00055DCEDD|nr:chemotaxis protein CheW [Mesoaciditoga lauensis]